MSRDLDFGPLVGPIGLRARLPAVAANPMLVLASTVSVLIAAIPLTVLVGLAIAGRAFDDVGAVVLIAIFFLAGVGAIWSVLHEAAKGGALEQFALANELLLVRGTAARDYASSVFADGSRIVQQSVRTNDQSFVEVGDLLHLRAPRTGHGTGPGRVDVGAPARPQVFLRGRLAGRVTGGRTLRIDSDLHQRVCALADDYEVELAEDEVTLWGTRRLGTDPDRVSEAFSVVDELVELANGHVDEPTPYVVTSADGAPGPRRWSAAKVVGLTLAMMVVLPLGFAFVMSILDNFTRNAAVAYLAVAFVAVVGRLIVQDGRRATGGEEDPDADGAPPPRRWVWLALGAVAFVALGITAVALDSGTADLDEDLASPADCATDDVWCQQDVATRVWVEDHGLERAGRFDWQSCELSAESWACPVRIDCPTGVLGHLVAVLAGQPLDVVGVRSASEHAGAPLRRSDGEVERLVIEVC